ncbi:MAG: hypothetical protein ACRCVH_03335 [Vagococcus fluvialis]
MNQKNIPTIKFNPETPTDLTVIKNLPKAIRDKAVELVNLMTNLEESKVTSSIQETLGYFPFIKSVFVQGNGNIPDALYVKKGDSWVGYGNYNYLPIIDENSKEGERITIHGKTYELSFSDSIKVWVEKPEITPVLFHDFFELPTSYVNATLNNQGIGDRNIGMYIEGGKRDERHFVPFLITSNNSRCATNAVLSVSERFTFTATFNSIGREYFDGTENFVPQSSKAVLLYVRDAYENVKIGLCYDENNNLHYFDKETVTSINKGINPNESTQFSIQLHGNTIKVLMNDLLIFTTENTIVKNKDLYFSLCNDMSYGKYANGACIVGDPIVFLDVLSNKELGLLYNKPRTFYYNSHYDTYLDLSVNDKISLKQFMESKRLTLNKNSLEKEFYLQELKLVSLYETEVSYGLADISYRPVIKTYLEELKSGIKTDLVRPSILNEYK